MNGVSVQLSKQSSQAPPPPPPLYFVRDKPSAVFGVLLNFLFLVSFSEEIINTVRRTCTKIIKEGLIIYIETKRRSGTELVSTC